MYIYIYLKIFYHCDIFSALSCIEQYDNFAGFMTILDLI